MAVKNTMVPLRCAQDNLDVSQSFQEQVLWTDDRNIDREQYI